MSFALRCKKFDELESEARAGTLTIGKLFGSPESCTVLGQQQKNIEAFVYEHMSEIIAIAVGGLPCPNQAVVKGTYEFMSELPLSFKMRVGPKAHKVLEYLMKLVIEDRPYIPKHVLGLFKQLYSITPNRKFESLTLFSEFMRKLITISPLMAIDDFIEYLSDRRLVTMSKLLYQPSFTGFVMESLEKPDTDERVLFRVARMLDIMTDENFLVEGNPFDVVRLFQLLIQRGIGCKNQRVRDAYLKLALRVITLVRGSDPNSAAYNQVLRALDEATNDICQSIVNSPVFQGDQVSACELIECVIEADIPLNDPVRTLMVELTNQFFDHPCCTILHHAFMSLVFCLDEKNPDEFVEFITAVNLMPRISELAFRDDLYGTIQLYPFIHQLCLLIDEKVSRGQLEFSDQWRNVQTTFTKPFTERLAEKEYGGHCPARTAELILDSGDETPTIPHRQLREVSPSEPE